MYKMRKGGGGESKREKERERERERGGGGVTVHMKKSQILMPLRVGVPLCQEIASSPNKRAI